jgi:zinc/manganese transport system substrate-binding protein
MKQMLALLFSLLLLPVSAYAELNVFACEPEWAALAKELGGELVNTFSATTGLQDPHHIEARPGLIAQASRADLLVCTGADLEAGWLPLLMQKSGNSRIRPDQPGYFMAAAQVELLDKPQRIDRSMGDIHAAGNPHIQTDPRRIARVAEALSQRLIALDQQHAQDYRQQYEDFAQRWDNALQEWEKRAASLRGKRIVVHHDSWIYLRDWLGLEQIATLEPKPGIPPSGKHLSRLLDELEKKPADLILYSSYQNPRSALWLAEKTQIPAVLLPATIGGTPEAKDLFSLFDDIIARLESSLQQ